MIAAATNPAVPILILVFPPAAKIPLDAPFVTATEAADGLEVLLPPLVVGDVLMVPEAAVPLVL